MKIENSTPLPGPRAEKAPIGKTSPKEGGQAFAAAFAKAMGAAQPAVEKPAKDESDLDTIKFRMKTGYYNTKSVTDALSEKLTGIFDELA